MCRAILWWWKVHLAVKFSMNVKANLYKIQSYTVKPWLSKPQLSKCSIIQKDFGTYKKIAHVHVTSNCFKSSLQSYWTHKCHFLEMVKEVCCSLPLRPYKTSKNCDQVVLLLFAATYSRCPLVTGSCKGTITSLLSKKVRRQNTGIYRIYNLQALRSALALLGCPGYKFCRSLCFEV